MQPDPVFEAIPEFEDPSAIEELPHLEIESTSLVEEPVAPEPPAIEPTFDLGVADVDVSPLEGLESHADPAQFAIEEESNGARGVEGLISADSGLSLTDQNPLESSPAEPGLGEPLNTEDPLAGLSLLEQVVIQEEVGRGLGRRPGARCVQPGGWGPLRGVRCVGPVRGVRSVGPALGADTDAVLREIAQCADDEIAALRDGGVVA